MKIFFYFCRTNQEFCNMKKKFFILLLFICSVSFYGYAQIFQAGIRVQSDIRNQAMPFNNLSVGLEADFNIPFIGVGLSVSGLFNAHYFENLYTDKLDDMYSYVTIPINLKWRVGVPVFRVILMAGPYLSLPLNGDIKKELNLKESSEANLVGLNIQLGFEIMKHYRLSVGYKGDLYMGKIDNYSDPSYGWYADLMYSF